MLPSAVVLHSEACFARQKRPREKNSTPPEMAPTDGQQIATGLTSPCPAWAEHGPFYGTQGRQQLTAYATEPPSFPIQLGVRSMELTYHGSKFKQAKSLRAYCARNDCSTHAHALQEVAKMQPFVTQRDIEFTAWSPSVTSQTLKNLCMHSAHACYSQEKWPTRCMAIMGGSARSQQRSSFREITTIF